MDDSADVGNGDLLQRAPGKHCHGELPLTQTREHPRLQQILQEESRGDDGVGHAGRLKVLFDRIFAVKMLNVCGTVCTRPAERTSVGHGKATRETRRLP
jgi:hypothetical protein